MKARPIILIGRRKGAIRAAKALGYDPVTIDVKARREQEHSAFGGTVKWALEEVSSVINPVGVVAVTTGSVMAAAAIRHHFQLPGISSEVALRCHDKLVMKKAIAAAGIPCAPWRETDESTNATQLIAELGLPLVLKMPISSGGRGVWICRSEDEVAKHLKPDLLAEGFVKGVEMSVETFRSNSQTVFRNPTCYLQPRFANVVPASLAPGSSRALDELSGRVHDALGISEGISHMEVFLTDRGPVFGEIAARPPGGYLMKLIARAYAINPWEVLIRLAVGEKVSISNNHRCHAGVWMLHPGQGEVTQVAGLTEARALAGVTRVSCKISPGDHLSERIGSGESVGQIFTKGPSFEHCCETLVKAKSLIRISMTPAS